MWFRERAWAACDASTLSQRTSIMSKKKGFFTGRDQERDTDETKLANQIARLLAIVPAHHTTPCPATAPFYFMIKAERLGSSVISVMAAFM